MARSGTTTSTLCLCVCDVCWMYANLVLLCFLAGQQLHLVRWYGVREIARYT
jgi:hypothetical protein